MATVIVLVHLNGKPLEDRAFKGSSPTSSLAGIVVGRMAITICRCKYRGGGDS
jgi:hypothetical protein